ncbi:MAG TPA: hypothetical protein VF170_19410, partial [Planctomycetaceae bacterium]
RSVVLFDSRNASARIDAEAAEALGYETIDAARLLTGRTADDDPDLTIVPAVDPRRRFFDALRPAVEGTGGLWVRVADFPHPYRWAVCDETAGPAVRPDSHREAAFAAALSAFAELPAAGGSAGRLPASDWLKTCAAAGRPVRVDGDPVAALARHELNPNGSPLTWVTSLVEFADWWRFRRRLAVRAVRRGRTCEIEWAAPGNTAGRFVPAVEIWRGRHAAVVPLKPGRTVVTDDSLPFQLIAARHPAGFTADAADSDFAGLPGRAVATAPA